MTRLLKNDAKGPQEVKAGDGSIWVCMCGLSANKPFCDGAHKKTHDENPDKIYIYSGENRTEI